MLERLADAGRGLVDWVLPLYRNTDFAYGVAATMALVAGVFAAIAILRHVAALLALRDRRRQISSFISFGRTEDGSTTSADPQEIQFAHRFKEIDAAMQKRGLLTGGLALAWRRYRKTFTFAGAPPIRTTQRPNSFFYGAMPPPSWLGFTANMFVGFGLLATFLGLVAALTFAAEGMRDADSSAMLAALRDLLAAAASKFVTSIAGVGLSILLNVLERVVTASLRRNLDGLSTAVELGLRVDLDAHSAAVAERLNRLADTLEAGAGVRGPLRELT